MEKVWLFVLYLGLLKGSLVAQQFNVQHGNNVRTSDLSSLMERIDSLHSMPHLVSALEESAISLERIPDIGRSLARISDLERFLKDTTESLSCKEAQKSIDAVQLMVQKLQSNFEGLQQTVENMKFSSRGASGGNFIASSPGSSDSFQSALDSDCICGLANRPPQIEGQIIGGVETGVNEYPWQVMLTITFTNTYSGRQDSYRCGGSVVSDQWVLTAAHCFAETGGVGDLTRLLVDLGDHVLRDELQFGVYNPDNITLIIHPKYENKNGIQH